MAEVRDFTINPDEFVPVVNASFVETYRIIRSVSHLFTRLSPLITDSPLNGNVVSRRAFRHVGQRPPLPNGGLKRHRFE